MTFMVNIGKWGGVYFHHGFSTRLCLGWIAFTFIPADMDEILAKWREERKGR